MNPLFILFYLFFLSGSTVTPERKHISKDIKTANIQQPKNPYYSRTDTAVLDVKDETWKQILSPEVYHVAREKGTERAFTGKYWNATGSGPSSNKWPRCDPQRPHNTSILSML